MKKRILVIGTATMDFIMNINKIPEPNEKVTENGEYRFVPGGKGANAAIAIQRLGGDCVFCAKLGRDAAGAQLRQLYINEGINLSALSFDTDCATGLSAVSVTDDGSVRTSVFVGANKALTVKDVEEAMLCYPDAVFLSFDLPEEIILAATHFASKKNIPLVIDAADTLPGLPLDHLCGIEIFSPNEAETEAYTQIKPDSADNALRAAVKLQKIVKANYYVIRMGERGSLVYDGKYYNIVPSYEVKHIDPSALGESFTAALTLEYLRSGNIMRACRYATAVGAMVVSSVGGISSIPTQAKLTDFIRLHGIQI